jgi:hypothetical protein
MFYRQPCKQWCGLSIQTNVYHDTTEPTRDCLGTYLDTEMMPSIVLDLQKKNIETTPYVNAFSETPDNGFMQFFDSPRYSTGYTSLFNTIDLLLKHT